MNGGDHQGPVVPQQADQRWRAHTWFARAIRLAVFLLPVAIAFAVGLALSTALHEPSGLTARIVRWLEIAAIVTVVLLVLQWLTKKLLPLAALFSLSLVFPDEVPSRFGLALRARTTRDLQRELTSGGALEHATPREAAEKVIELTAALSRHDRMTRGHSERVRAYTRMLGEELGLGAHQIDRLHWAGLIHDVGKIGVDSAILNKPGQLTTDEFEAIKQHTIVGQRLAEPLQEWLGDATSAVWEHHERFDGGGYPTGRPASALPLSSRIVSVADAFDVMTSARSYKRPMSATAARSELERCAGTQFDPHVVRAMMTISLGKLWRAIGPLSLVAQMHMIPRRVLQGGAAVTVAIAVIIGAGLTALADTVTGGSPAGEDAASSAEPDDVAEPASLPVTVPPSTDAMVAPTTAPQPTTTTTSTSTTTTSTTTTNTTTSTTTTTTTSTTTLPVAATTSPTVTTTIARPPAGAGPVTPTTTLPPPTPEVTTTTIAIGPGRFLLATTVAGDVASQPVLPLVVRVPLNPGPLPNFDTDRDGGAGLTIQRSDQALESSDPAAVQRWRSVAQPTTTITTARLAAWVAAAPDGVPGARVVSAGLYACSSGVCTLVGSRAIPFVASSETPVGLSFDVSPSAPLMLAAGTELEVRIAAPGGSSGAIVVAYDTVGFPSELAIS